MSKPMYEVYPGKIANQIVRREKRKVKILQQRIDKAIESIKEDIDYWQDAIYVELEAEDFIEILNKYLEILGDEENE